MIGTKELTGLILAGGRATRMGEIDKGLQAFHGYPLVIHVVTRLAPQVGTILINANRHREIYEQLGHRVIGDVIDDAIDEYAGPLAGLHAGLAACESDYLVAVPCDAPFLPRDLVARLGEGMSRGMSRGMSAGLRNNAIDVAYATTASGRHPVFCMMRRAVAPSLATFVREGGRSVGAWLDRMNCIAVSFEHEDAFRNLNTLEELRDAERGA